MKPEDFILNHRKELGTDKKVFGIVGSRRYQSESRIRKFIYELNKKHEDNLIIVSGGQREGADGFAKNAALEFKINYIEFPPAHYSYNQHCILPAAFYSKEYRPYFYHERNTHIALLSDVVIAFIPQNMKITESRGTNDTYTKAKKFGKKRFIFY